MATDNRRSTDPDVIDQMIAEEPNEQNRMFLLILNNINKSLIANTDTIREVSDKLDKHLTRFETHVAAEDRLLNQGRGAWRVAAWVIGAVQAIGLAIWIDSRAEIEEIHTSIHTLEVKQAQTQTECDALKNQFMGGTPGG